MMQERFTYHKPLIEKFEVPYIEHDLYPPFNILAEVEIAQQYLDENGKLPNNILEYLILNERTQALESTTKVIHTTHQIWQPDSQELNGYGLSIKNLTQSGVDDAQRIIQRHGRVSPF